MKQVFPIVPASSSPMVWFGVFCVFMVALIIFIYFVTMSSRNTKFEVTSTGIQIKGTLYGRMLPFETLKLDEAQAVNLNQQSEYRLGWYTRNGSSMPGYKAGWFRNTKGKMLVHMTDPTRVLYIPTNKGYGVMISVEQPEKVLEALKQSSLN